MNNEIQGWINLYKPKNISSFQAINKIKYKYKVKKIGHAGTLDPLAEGILPIAIGKTTKLIQFINSNNKKYIFSVEWGTQTSTDDKEGSVIKHSDKVPTEEEIKFKVREFLGIINQVPPHASAVKVNGISAYKLHRENKKITLKSKKVSLIQIKILKSFHNKTFFEIECGKGFYVRSFARDLAISLGTFGHVNTLKRTKVGKFLLDSAILLDDLLKKGKRLQEFNCIHSSISMLDDILACEIEEKEKLLSLSLGKSINVDLNELIDPPLNSFDNNFLFLSNKGNIISYGKLNGNLFKPKKILI